MLPCSEWLKVCVWYSCRPFLSYKGGAGGMSRERGRKKTETERWRKWEWQGGTTEEKESRMKEEKQKTGERKRASSVERHYAWAVLLTDKRRIGGAIVRVPFPTVPADLINSGSQWRWTMVNAPINSQLFTVSGPPDGKEKTQVWTFFRHSRIHGQHRWIIVQFPLWQILSPGWNNIFFMGFINMIIVWFTDKNSSESVFKYIQL